MKKKVPITPEEAMEINTLLYEAHGGYKLRTFAANTEISTPKIENHLKILEKNDLVVQHSERWNFTGAGFTAYANILVGNPGE